MTSMWKFLSRGVRETFERRIGFSRKDKATGQDCSLSALQNKLIPGIVSSHTFDNDCKNGTWGDKKERRRERQGTRWQADGCLQQPRLLGALGWSGVMVLGWYLCQPICHRQRAPPQQRTEYVSLLRVLSRVVLAQPLGVLPQPLGMLPQPVDAMPFGPVTAEQALDEAAEGLKQVQGDMVNRLGVACLQLGRQTEAVTHFRSAALLGCASAAFNLGLCHELGVGTVRDLKQAAHYYEEAAQGGHATAMYNLGVFCVRGWGGLPVDCARARQLFEAAAELGQRDAREALSMLPAKNLGQGGLMTQILGLLNARHAANVPPPQSDNVGLNIYEHNDFSVVC